MPVVVDLPQNVLCPRPRDIIQLTPTGFEVNGIECSTLLLTAGGSGEWRDRQNASLDFYEEQHVRGDIDRDREALYKLFGSYINAAALGTGKPHPLVLDVGCGMFQQSSPALTKLDTRCSYVGLDPLAHHLQRSYRFVCGRLEDMAGMNAFTGLFDIFVCGTSIDHLEDLSSAAAAMRQLAAPGAVLVCWNGLQDPERIIGGNAVAVFRKLVGYRWWCVAMAAYAAYGMMRLPRLLRQMRARRRAIRSNDVLDHHVRWFTEANTTVYLSEFGEVMETVVIPNTQHSFSLVRVGMPQRKSE